MAEYAIQIVKRMPFQGAGEEFSNVWTFGTGLSESLDDEANIDFLVAAERAVHSNQVTFVRASSYGIGGPDAGNVMREIKDLSGVGTMAGSTDLYRECANMISFDLPRSLLLRRRRIARKWFHSGSPFPAGTASAQQLAAGVAAYPAATQSFINGWWTGTLNGGALPGGGQLGSNGDAWGVPTVYPYVEHRQFHRGRKRGGGLL